jgi:cold shock CspA family protein
MGRVEAFDEKRGLGSVRELSDAQREAVLFHCTAILDESRTIPPGTLVSYALIAGNRGEIQATDICRLEPDS